MEQGYWRKSIRAKEGAYDTIDNITKFALYDDDYEEYEEFIQYTSEQLAKLAKAEAETKKKTEQELFLKEAPMRLSNTEAGLEDVILLVAEMIGA